ncbi:MAG: caspase family protein [Burkholderiaceae bacterium]|nr:caspase family protein [Sulfuritalea sp.]MCF8175798.1 caspase family protein [Burkholderiaceae bacterium]MCF8184045.1 caspase family protein [Polynucleobacter sp.]
MPEFEACRSETRRRLVLGSGAGLALSSLGFSPELLAQAIGDPIQDVYVPRAKYALLIGNRDYPNRKDIAPAHKNVRDLKEVLQYYEFKVNDYLDLDSTAMMRTLAEFSAQMSALGETRLPGGVAVVFYFCGHGFQSSGNNYLVPAGVDPSSEKALNQSLRLHEDILAAFPQSYPGISIALIDACRTDPSIRRGVDDFNQIKAPEGMLVFFATRAGRPALAPISPDRNTFFAGAVVDVLRDANGVTPIDDLFRIAAVECQSRVQSEFDKAGLKIPPQFPESTTNLRGRFLIRNRILELRRSERKQQQFLTPDGVVIDAAKLEDRLRIILNTLRPSRLIRLCEAFDRDFPGSEFNQQIKVTLAGARQALESQRSAGLSSDLFADTVGDKDYRDDLIKALRGDKDSAHRIAVAYREGTSGVTASPRRTEQWLRFAAELGNGIASWELSEIYNQAGQVGDAARFENKALELGYRPPPRLATRGY